MKCPSCEYNHKKKDVERCLACSYKFVLSTDAKINDYAFSKLLQQCTQDNTVFFTKNNMYSTYLQCNILKKKKQRTKTYGIIAVISFFVCFSPIFPVGIIAFLFSFAKWIQYKKFFKGISFKEFVSYIPKWQNALITNKQTQLNFLIDKTNLVLRKAPPKTTENDIFNYGLEGIVFVDNDYYVDWLILNNFHFTYRVAVLSMNSYPNYLVPEIKQVIEKNPLLPIYFLHDGIIKKPEIMENLNTYFSFEKQRYLIDIGLSSNDFMKVNFLKEKAKYIPFSENYPLDTLQYSQVCTLFANVKAKFDSAPRTQEFDDDGNEIMIIDDSFMMMNMGMQSSNFNTNNMDLDFG